MKSILHIIQELFAHKKPARVTTFYSDTLIKSLSQRTIKKHNCSKKEWFNHWQKDL